MENNDYTSLDWLLPPPSKKRTLNEDFGGISPTGSAPAPTQITNPPAESSVAAVTDPIPAWITDGIAAWEELLKKNPGSKEIKAELERMKAMLPTVKEANEKPENDLRSADELKKDISQMVDNWNDYSIVWDGMTGKLYGEGSASQSNKTPYIGSIKIADCKDCSGENESE